MKKSVVVTANTYTVDFAARKIDANCGKDHALKETRKWFKTRYPNYDDVPRFDTDGYLVTEKQEGGDKDSIHAEMQDNIVFIQTNQIIKAFLQYANQG